MDFEGVAAEENIFPPHNPRPNKEERLRVFRPDNKPGSVSCKLPAEVIASLMQRGRNQDWRSVRKKSRSICNRNMRLFLLSGGRKSRASASGNLIKSLEFSRSGKLERVLNFNFRKRSNEKFRVWETKLKNKIFFGDVFLPGSFDDNLRYYFCEK